MTCDKSSYIQLTFPTQIVILRDLDNTPLRLIRLGVTYIQVMFSFITFYASVQGLMQAASEVVTSQPRGQAALLTRSLTGNSRPRILSVIGPAILRDSDALPLLLRRGSSESEAPPCVRRVLPTRRTHGRASEGARRPCQSVAVWPGPGPRPGAPPKYKLEARVRLGHCDTGNFG